MKYLSSLGLAILLICGCGASPQELPREKAAKSIQDELFSYCSNNASITVDLGRVAKTCGLDADSGEYVFLRDTGMINIVKVGAGSANAYLTAKGQQLLDEYKEVPYAHREKYGCKIDQINFPVATRKFVEVTGITATDKAKRVEFRSKWLLNKLGEHLFKESPQIKKLDARQLNELAVSVSSGINHELSKLDIPVWEETYAYGSVDAVVFQQHDDGWRLKR